MLAAAVASVSGCFGCTCQDSATALEHIGLVFVCVLLMILSLARLMLKKLMKPWYHLYMDGDIHPCQEAQEPLAVHHGDILPFSARHHDKLLAILF